MQHCINPQFNIIHQTQNIIIMLYIIFVMYIHVSLYNIEVIYNMIVAI